MGEIALKETKNIEVERNGDSDDFETQMQNAELQMRNAELQLENMRETRKKLKKETESQFDASPDLRSVKHRLKDAYGNLHVVEESKQKEKPSITAKFMKKYGFILIVAAGIGVVSLIAYKWHKKQ